MNTQPMRLLRAYPLVSAVAATGALGGVLALSGAGADARWTISVVCLILAVRLIASMIAELRSGSYGVDLLAIIAIVSTVLVGEYWASLVICLMLTGGEALEDYAQTRAQRSLTSLLDNAPSRADRVLPDSTVEQVPVDAVEPGDRVRVLPGELVGIDGTLMVGNTEVDESSLTGESMPVLKRPGDTVLAGSINGSSVIVMRSDATAAGSQYQRIVELVRQAQASRPPFVALADRVAIPFTVVSLLIAAAARTLSGDPARFAEVLVVATPCPLIIAAPVAFMAGMSRAARAGIIVRDSGSLEKLARIRTAAFDKTGTLTAGRPSVTDIVASGGHDTDEVLALAAAAEQMSTHPLATAITAEAARRRLRIAPAQQARQTTSAGITAVVDGRTVRVGTARFAMGTDAFAGRDDQVSARTTTNTHVHVSCDGWPAGVIEVSDPVRPEAARTLAELSTMGVADTMMLTGDGPVTATRVAERLSIADVRGGLAPAGKLQAVADAPARPVMMVGDGVNDAPVLAASDVGVAMGAKGSAAAVESADVIVMKDDLHRVAMAMRIGRRTLSVAWQAIGIGVSLSLGLMLVGAAGVMPAVVGAGAQELVDLTCILWALLSSKPSRREREAGTTDLPERVAAGLREPVTSEGDRSGSEILDVQAPRHHAPPADTRRP